MTGQENPIVLLSSQGRHARTQRRFCFVLALKHLGWKRLAALRPLIVRGIEDLTHLNLKRITVRGTRNVFHMPPAIIQVAGFQAVEVLGLGPAIGDHRRRPGRGLWKRRRLILSSPLARYQAQDEASHGESALVHSPLPEGFSPRRQVDKSRLDTGCNEGTL